MVHAFAVSSVVRDTTNIKMFGVLPLTEQNFFVKELATFSVSILKSTHAAFLPCQIWTDSYFSIVADCGCYAMLSCSFPYTSYFCAAVRNEYVSWAQFALITLASLRASAIPLTAATAVSGTVSLNACMGHLDLGDKASASQDGSTSRSTSNTFLSDELTYMRFYSDINLGG